MSILLLEEIHPHAQAWLAERHSIVIAKTPNLPGMACESRAISTLITRGIGQVTFSLLDQLPGLKLVARAGVGLNNVDVEACTVRGIRVMNAPGATTTAVSELTLFFILSLVRRIGPLIESVREGDWSVRNRYGGDDIRGKKLGIIGMGDIGLRVAEMGTACGLEVIYWNHRPKRTSFTAVSLDELIATADIISLHIPLTPETRNFFDAPRFAAMKPGAILLNTARGGLINQNDLLVALDSGHLAGFAADVLDPEVPDSCLLNRLARPEVLITPHCAALTAATYAKTCLRTVQNIDAFLTGRTPEPGCIVNACSF